MVGCGFGRLWPSDSIGAVGVVAGARCLLCFEKKMGEWLVAWEMLENKRVSYDSRE
jgi:hypothetical protein